MPTTRPRHLLTETDAIAQAIDAAAHLYPGASRADILRYCCVVASARAHHVPVASLDVRLGNHSG